MPAALVLRFHGSDFARIARRRLSCCALGPGATFAALDEAQKHDGVAERRMGEELAKVEKRGPGDHWEKKRSHDVTAILPHLAKASP